MENGKFFQKNGGHGMWPPFDFVFLMEAYLCPLPDELKLATKVRLPVTLKL